ncbi:MAG: glycosyltransferase family 2 protein [Rhodospirillales bacterium]
MWDFFATFLGYVKPSTLVALEDRTLELLTSLDPYFWILIVLPIIRFQVPVLVAWVIHMVKPDFWMPASHTGREKKLPFVSVLIAGRNEEDTIGATIKSVLNCGYPNLEIIFVDDYSDDATLFQARKYEKTGRVRIFASQSRNGKPSSLNIAISMARGEYFFIVDADSDVQYGSIHDLLEPLKNPRVGAVAANLRVRNATENLCTRLQECEYALNVTMSRMWRAKVNLLSIVPGAGGMFRASAVRALKGFDSGLGDDTDLTMRLLKAGWRLRFATGGIVWTNVPTRFRALARQRMRWERNMVKIRIRKQRSLASPGLFGGINTFMMIDLFAVRIFLPLMFVIGFLGMFLTGPFQGPMLLTHLYWITMVFSALKLSIAHDIVGTPRSVGLWLVPIIPFYRLCLKLIVILAISLEFLRIGIKHPYVPDKIWQQMPHW